MHTTVLVMGDWSPCKPSPTHWSIRRRRPPARACGLHLGTTQVLRANRIAAGRALGRDTEEYPGPDALKEEAAQTQPMSRRGHPRLSSSPSSPSQSAAMLTLDEDGRQGATGTCTRESPQRKWHTQVTSVVEYDAREGGGGG